MSGLKCRTPFLMERPLLFKRWFSTRCLWKAFSLTWSMWVDQVSRFARVTPDNGLCHPTRLAHRREQLAEGFGYVWVWIASQCCSTRWWRSSISRARAVIRWGRDPVSWQAELAFETWLWRPCRPRRELARHGWKGREFHWHTGWRGQGISMPFVPHQPVCHGERK
jgi:hypothetical protein